MLLAEGFEPFEVFRVVPYDVQGLQQLGMGCADPLHQFPQAPLHHGLLDLIDHGVTDMQVVKRQLPGPFPLVQ